MKYASLFLACLLAIGLVACGGTSSTTTTSTNPATGTWSETFTGSSNQQLGSMNFKMNQSGTSLTGSTMDFSQMGGLSQCFGTGTTIVGQMGQGMMQGGTMNMTMTWTPPGSATANTMVMQGNMAMGMGSGSGTFTLTGQTPGCTSQTGTFTMTHTGQ